MDYEPCGIQCSECEGTEQPHHWLPDMDGDGEPVATCKHCDFAARIDDELDRILFDEDE